MGVDAAITVLLALLNNAGQISLLIQKAQGEGRTTLSAEEWKAITDSADGARASLVAAINAQA